MKPDPDGMNDSRAEWAGEAVTAFARATDTDTAGENDQTILADLLSDLMHWCDRHAVDFYATLSDAYRTYNEEVEGA